MCCAMVYPMRITLFGAENVENLGRSGAFIGRRDFSAEQNNGPNGLDGVAILGQSVSFQWRSIVSDPIK